MKQLLLFSMAFLIGGMSFGQKAAMKPGFKAEKAVIQNKISDDPETTPLKQLPVAPKPKPVNNNGDNPNIVTILDIGNSANGFGYGYAGGQKTMVWADDNLKAVVNIHRMGPGSTPPSFSGYLAGDLGTNYGATQGDWQKNRQIYSATLVGGEYYLDAARYPQGGIYNPEGNTALENAYITFYAPNLSNAPTGNSWGGLSYGVDNCVDQADSTKHLYWFNPPPFTYIPDGFAISKNGVVLVTDIDQEWANNVFVGYQGNLIVTRGIWNDAAKDFEYTMSTVPCPTTGNMRPSSDRVAFSPDGQTAWIVVLSNNFYNLDSNYYPIVLKSTDAGQTWSAPIDVIIDGPTGIPGITQHLLSDHRIEQVFLPPLPTREEIPYTTAFDCRISVDKWGNPHIGVVVGICAGGYAISIPNSPPPNAYDSTFAVYDIYSTDGGTTWSGQLMGYLASFRGDWQATGSTPVTEDNRTCIASNMTGDKMFLTWNDTHVDQSINNNECDIFARGFDLVENKITKNKSDLPGQCAQDMVTYISDNFQEANFQCLSYYVFSNHPSQNKWTLPIVYEYLTSTQDIGTPVDFKYVADFSYSQDDFVCDVFPENPGFPTGVNDVKKETSFNMTIFPNPVSGASTVTVTTQNSGNLSMDVTNLVGQKVISVEKGFVNAGKQTLTLDGSKLSPGVYFCTVKVGEQSVTKKVIVK